MQNKNRRSNTNDLILENQLDNLTHHQRNSLTIKKPYHLNRQKKSFKAQIFSSQKEEQIEKDTFQKFNDFGSLSKKKQQSKINSESKLPIINKIRSYSSQLQTYNQPSSDSTAELINNIKQEKISMRLIFKSINQILSKHSQKPIQTKNTGEFQNEKNFNNQNTLKQLSLLLRLSEFLNQNKNHMIDIGKYIQDRIEQKRINNFQQQYKNAAKYQSEEDINGDVFTSKELQKIEEIKNRRKVIIQMAQKKSPKFLYPLGPKIRVRNYSLENQYFQIQQDQMNRAKGCQLYHNNRNISNQEDEISIQKLNSPPKDKFFPTSSMQEDYLNIKIQQILRSLL
ncbi:unnamed protein product [Paramecium sonneborni]|uniref:Uncharacterized protein n=1 Tax=Paramecium sonneborni TaxID=65129 RepID=A0A8S1KZI9_9CILI|nr:unnamed protein product [Paramecium sonneborni]